MNEDLRIPYPFKGNIIPTEVIDSWLKGEYLVGVTQSIGYQYLGLSLLLRGLYRYKCQVGDYIPHWGYCYIDVKDEDLVFAGVRIHTRSGKPEVVNSLHPLYWRSIFSKFISNQGEEYPHIYFAYLSHTIPDDEGNSYLGHYQALVESRLTVYQEKGLRAIDDFWNNIRRNAPNEELPNSPPDASKHPDEFMESFENDVLNYLADRDQFDRHIEILDSLDSVVKLLGLADINLNPEERFNAKGEKLNPKGELTADTFKAKLQLFSSRLDEETGRGDYIFSRVKFSITGPSGAMEDGNGRRYL